MVRGKSCSDPGPTAFSEWEESKNPETNSAYSEEDKLVRKKAKRSLLQLYAPRPGASIKRVFQKNDLPRSSKRGSKTRKIGLNTYTPPPQQQRIKQKYMDGMSIRRIAREEHK